MYDEGIAFAAGAKIFLELGPFGVLVREDSV